MGLFSRLFGRSETGAAPAGATAAPEHAVILSIKLTGDGFGTPEDRTRMHAIQDGLAAAIQRASAGELDGDEFGAGMCNVYMYGPDADRLWDAIAPVLEKHPFAKGSSALKRYGSADDARARQETIDLAWEG